MEKYKEFQFKGQTIRGMEHFAFHPSSTTICVHGFTGSRIDHHRFMLLLARTLHSQNHNVLRFDFIGSGESDGDFSQMSFQSEYEQLVHILHSYNQPVNVIGFSMGGLLAAKLAGDYPDKINKLVLLSPAFNIIDVFENACSLENLLEDGNYDVGGHIVTKKAFEEIYAVKAYEGIERFKKQVCIVHGEKDEPVPAVVSEPLLALYENVVRHVVIGADHCYSKMSYTNKMFEHVVSFLK